MYRDDDNVCPRNFCSDELISFIFCHVDRMPGDMRQTPQNIKCKNEAKLDGRDGMDRVEKTKDSTSRLNPCKSCFSCLKINS